MNRSPATISVICLTSLLLAGASTQSCNTTQTSGSIGPSKGEVIGAAVGIVAIIGVGTVVLIEVHNSHHTIKGCVTAGPSGIQVYDFANQRTYYVTGATANVKAGDLVRLHGNKEKKKKGDPGQAFVVEKITKDYRPCKDSEMSPATASPSPAAPGP
jgi:hypothetical protein